VFVHEFLGEHRSWEAQMRYFSRKYRCVAYNARGYPPSDVPDGRCLFVEHQRSDLRALLDALASTRRTSSACRWARSRPSTSA